MDDPLRDFRVPLDTLKDVEDRIQHTQKIKKYLALISNENWRTLYRAEFDGSLWIEEYPFGEMHGGGPTCIYLIQSDNPTEQILEQQAYLTSNLRKRHDAKVYWDQLGEEKGPEICREDGCTRKRIKMSVLCKVHHFENVRNETCPFE